MKSRTDGKMLPILGKKRAINVIWGISRKPKSFRQLREFVGGSYTTLRERLLELKSAGLVGVGNNEPEWPYRHRFFLTPKGEEIAELLSQIEKVR